MAMNKNVIIGALGFFLIIGGAVYLSKGILGPGGAGPIPSASSEPSKYDDFAKCLNEKGAKMYGAFWCGHCKNQKEALGSAFQYVNYQECTVDGKQNSFAQVCKDAGINFYPTWKFSDGATVEKGLLLSELAEKTGCALPQ